MFSQPSDINTKYYNELHLVKIPQNAYNIREQNAGWHIITPIRMLEETGNRYCVESNGCSDVRWCDLKRLPQMGCVALLPQDHDCCSHDYISMWYSTMLPLHKNHPLPAGWC